MVNLFRCGNGSSKKTESFLIKEITLAPNSNTDTLIGGNSIMIDDNVNKIKIGKLYNSGANLTSSLVVQNDDGIIYENNSIPSAISPATNIEINVENKNNVRIIMNFERTGSAAGLPALMRLENVEMVF